MLEGNMLRSTERGCSKVGRPGQQSVWSSCFGLKIGHVLAKLIVHAPAPVGRARDLQGREVAYLDLGEVERAVSVPLHTPREPAEGRGRG